MAAGVADQLAAQGLVGANSGLKALLPVVTPAVAHPAAVLDALRIVVGPMHESTQVVPLIHATHVHPIAHAQWDTFREIDVVRYKQRPAIACIDNEPLVTRAFIVI